MQNPVVWFEIYVDDITRARGFYEQVFQCKLTQLVNTEIEELWAFPSDQACYGTSGALVKMTDKAAGNNSTIVYFSCSDCAIEQQRVIEKGGKVFKEKFSIGEYGYIALVFDSEGNMIGLHSMH